MYQDGDFPHLRRTLERCRHRAVEHDVARLDRVTAAEQQRTLSHVLQFADVAPPIVQHQLVDRLVARLENDGTVAGVTQDQHGGECVNVLRAVGQRLGREREHGKTAIEIGTKYAVAVVPVVVNEISIFCSVLFSCL